MGKKLLVTTSRRRVTCLVSGIEDVILRNLTSSKIQGGRLEPPYERETENARRLV